MDLIILRLLKGHCHGNQFWGKSSNPTFISSACISKWISVTIPTAGLQEKYGIKITAITMILWHVL